MNLNHAIKHPNSVFLEFFEHGKTLKQGDKYASPIKYRCISGQDVVRSATFVIQFTYEDDRSYTAEMYTFLEVLESDPVPLMEEDSQVGWIRFFEPG